MRLISAGIVVGSLLVASLASAADGKGGGDNGKGSAGGSSGSAGSSAGGAASQSGQTTRVDPQTTPDDTESENAGPRSDVDKLDPFASKSKSWEVGLAFTTHRLVVQSDLAGGTADPTAEPGSGAGTDKMINDYEGYIRYDITKNDRVAVRAYMYQRFLADSGENGVRFDDIVLTYSHTFTLPKKFNLTLGLLATIPTSYDSYLAGTITTTRFTVEADRRFGPLSLDARTYVGYDIQSEESIGDGAGYAPNTLAHVGIVADAELHMPFHEPLSVGAGIATGYTWYHNISGQAQVVQDATFATQPIQQTYGGEVYARYLMPSLAGFKPDITLAYAMGDATIGYSNVLHDGVGHLYLGYRENSEFYLRLAVAY
jgi:hypothetical protein